MANHYFYQFPNALEKKVVTLFFQIPITAAGAVGTIDYSKNKGLKGVVHNAAGLYTLTLGNNATGGVDSYARVLNLSGQTLLIGGANTIEHVGLAAQGSLASLIVQDLTYTAVANGNGSNAAGNNITITYTAGGVTGSEVVTVRDSNINVSMHTGVSTATQILTAVRASALASALVNVVVSGTGSTAQVAATVASLSGGVQGISTVQVSCLSATATNADPVDGDVLYLKVDLKNI